MSCRYANTSLKREASSRAAVERNVSHHTIEDCTALALGIGSTGMRADPGGLVIELLRPPLRDHMPDRYIEAT